MRFYLDNDTDASCCEVFRSAGHESWTTAEAGRSLSSDDDQAAYAADMNAVIVTHDKEFAQRQRRNTVGQMLFLKCEQPDAPDVVDHFLPTITPVLKQMRLVVIELRVQNFVVYGPQWQ